MTDIYTALVPDALKNHRRRRGFSLIEILVVVLIMGVAFIPLFGMFITGTKGAEEVTHNTVAVNLAAETLEIISNLPFSELDNYAAYQAPPVDIHGITFTKEVSVEDVLTSAGGAPALKKIEVSVTWKDKRGEPRDVVLGTMAGNQEI